MNTQLRTKLLLRPKLNWFIWLISVSLLPMKVISQTTGEIMGQVVAEDGKTMANVAVSISAPGADRARAISRSTTTDENGRFQFRNLPNRGYGIFANGQKGYVFKTPVSEDRTTVRYHPGDNITITMVHGGVITGLVTNASGDPLINIAVSAIRVRDQEGNKVGPAGGGPSNFTDDRGIYRIYGLTPGTYIVTANSATFFNGTPSPYYGETPTYHPSSTRDTAAEVKVSGGDEATGINIRYRGESGHAVSGKVFGGESPASNFVAGVTLRNVSTGAVAGSAGIQQGMDESSFAIYGVSDGEYELTASRNNPDSDEFFSAEHRRVTVKGTDVAGIELRMMPMASVTGRIIVEKSPAVCDAKLKPSLEDVSITAVHDERADARPASPPRFFSRSGVPDEKGEFKINGLAPARYRLQTSLPNETWIVKSISGLAPAAGRLNAAKPIFVSDLTRASMPLKSGEKLTGVSITVTDGGASLRGKLVPKDGSTLPARISVHLVPAEPAAADDVLRYAERIATNTGVFAFTNIAPGKYWLLARPVVESDQPDRSAPARWDATERAQLRKDAEAAKNEIELKPCSRIKDHELRF